MPGACQHRFSLFSVLLGTGFSWALKYLPLLNTRINKQTKIKARLPEILQERGGVISMCHLFQSQWPAKCCSGEFSSKALSQGSHAPVFHCKTACSLLRGWQHYAACTVCTCYVWGGFHLCWQICMMEVWRSKSVVGFPMHQARLVLPHWFNRCLQIVLGTLGITQTSIHFQTGTLSCSKPRPTEE